MLGRGAENGGDNAKFVKIKNCGATKIVKVDPPNRCMSENCRLQQGDEGEFTCYSEKCPEYEPHIINPYAVLLAEITWADLAHDPQIFTDSTLYVGRTPKRRDGIELDKNDRCY